MAIEQRNAASDSPGRPWSLPIERKARGPAGQSVEKFGQIVANRTLADMAFTLDSAYQYARKRGSLWKGRIQAIVNGV